MITLLVSPPQVFCDENGCGWPFGVFYLTLDGDLYSRNGDYYQYGLAGAGGALTTVLPPGGQYVDISSLFPAGNWWPQPVSGTVSVQLARNVTIYVVSATLYQFTPATVPALAPAPTSAPAPAPAPVSRPPSQSPTSPGTIQGPGLHYDPPPATTGPDPMETKKLLMWGTLGVAGLSAVLVLRK